MALSWIYLVFALINLPPVEWLKHGFPARTSYMDQYGDAEAIRYQPVPLPHISSLLQQAVILSEDDQFYQHEGIDPEAIKAAARVNWRRKRFSFGGSTITMQLARNLFLSPDKTPLRKLREVMIALKLELSLPKKRILELYLNTVEWGDGVFGAEAAARHYFGTSAAGLSKQQAAFLAAILPRPRYYDRHRNGPHLQNRIATIEARL